MLTDAYRNDFQQYNESMAFMQSLEIPSSESYDKGYALYSMTQGSNEDKE